MLGVAFLPLATTIFQRKSAQHSENRTELPPINKWIALDQSLIIRRIIDGSVCPGLHSFHLDACFVYGLDGPQKCCNFLLFVVAWSGKFHDVANNGDRRWCEDDWIYSNAWRRRMHLGTHTCNYRSVFVGLPTFVGALALATPRLPSASIACCATMFVVTGHGRAAKARGLAGLAGCPSWLCHFRKGLTHIISVILLSQALAQSTRW